MATKYLNDATITTITSLTSAHYVNVINNSTGKIQKITVANLKSQLATPVTAFGVILTQTGTSAPTQNVVFNTTGQTFTYSRTGAGDYDLIASSTIFPASGMILLATNGASAAAISISRTDSSTLNIKCSGDNILSGASIKVEIYF